MYEKWGYECILVKIYILHLRQDNIVTHIGHHGCVYDIISSNVLKGTQSNTELGNIHNTGNTLQYNTIQYNTMYLQNCPKDSICTNM